MNTPVMKSNWVFPKYNSTPKFLNMPREVLKDAGIFVVEPSTIDFYPWQKYYLKQIDPKYCQEMGIV